MNNPNGHARRPGQAGFRFERLLGSIPPAAGAEVMGTGIVSIGLSFAGLETLSRIVLAIAVVLYVPLAILLPARASRDPTRFLAEVRTPAALTSVAGTAVIGERLTMLGWTWAGGALLVLALAFWLLLLGPVLRNWTTPTTGASLILTVATESLAVLAGSQAAAGHARWLLIIALVPFGLGLAFYAVAIVRFDLRQLTVASGDHWITGGALAISTLAAGRLEVAARALNMTGTAGTLREVAIALWLLTMAWLPALAQAEARHPRLHYDMRRWSTVFPLGMYAAASFLVGIVWPSAAVTTFARGWIWIAVAIWAIVFGSMAARAIGTLRGSQSLRQDHDGEVARPVNALHARELDVAGRGRT